MIWLLRSSCLLLPIEANTIYEVLPSFTFSLIAFNSLQIFVSPSLFLFSNSAFVLAEALLCVSSAKIVVIQSPVYVVQV